MGLLVERFLPFNETLDNESKPKLSTVFCNSMKSHRKFPQPTGTRTPT